MKRIICFFLGHKWTSKAMKGIPPKEPLSIDGFRDHRRMYCDRCKTESILNKLLPLILLLCCLVGCVSKQKPSQFDEAMKIAKECALQRDTAIKMAQELAGLCEIAQRQRDSIKYLYEQCRLQPKYYKHVETLNQY